MASSFGLGRFSARRQLRQYDYATVPAESRQDEPRLRLRTADLASRGIKDETVVLDLRSSTYLSTNSAGSVLWRELEAGTTRSRLVRRLLEEFEVREEQATSDVDAFLDECRRRELLAEDPPRDEAESG